MAGGTGCVASAILIRPRQSGFVVDALENHRMVGADPKLMENMLIRQLRQGKYDRARLREAAEGYASPATRARVFRVLGMAE